MNGKVIETNKPQKTATSDNQVLPRFNDPQVEAKGRAKLRGYAPRHKAKIAEKKEQSSNNSSVKLQLPDTGSVGGLIVVSSWGNSGRILSRTDLIGQVVSRGMGAAPAREKYGRKVSLEDKTGFASAAKRAKAKPEPKLHLSYSEIVSPDKSPKELNFVDGKWFLINLTDFELNKAVEWAKEARLAARDQGVFVFKVVVFSNLPFASDVNRAFSGTGIIVRRYRNPDFFDAVAEFEDEIRRTKELVEEGNKED